MKLGFQLKGTTKRQKIVKTNEDEVEKVDIITAIEDSNISSTAPKNDEKQLVIPLIPSKNSIVAAVKDNKSKSLHEIAAEEILQELTGEKPTDDDNQLIIKQNAKKTQGDKPLPLLLANIDPELLKSGNDEERYQKDMAMRADDVNFRSDVYEAVPVEQFGAALLRGMGWGGPSNDDKKFAKDNYETDIKPRESRLGLGALPKPPEKKGDKKGPKSGFDKKSEEKKKRDYEAWMKKAENRISQQTLKIDDLIWIRDHNFVGKRAKIVKISGVPGLNKMRVQIEGKSGEIVDINKKDGILLSLEELNEKPYQHSLENNLNLENQRHQDEVKYHGNKDLEVKKEKRRRSPSRDSYDSRKNRRKNNEKYDKYDDEDVYKKERNRDSHDRRDYDRHRHHDRENRHDRKEKKSERDSNEVSNNKKHNKEANNIMNMKVKSENDRNNSLKTPKKNWLYPSIMVYVKNSAIPGSKKNVDLKQNFQIGTVLDVHAADEASIQLKNGSVIASMKQQYLKPILPKEKGECIILHGSHRGAHGKVLEIQKSDGGTQVLVELLDDLEVSMFNGDSIAACA